MSDKTSREMDELRGEIFDAIDGIREAEYLMTRGKQWYAEARQAWAKSAALRPIGHEFVEVRGAAGLCPRAMRWKIVAVDALVITSHVDVVYICQVVIESTGALGKLPAKFIHREGRWIRTSAKPEEVPS